MNVGNARSQRRPHFRDGGVQHATINNHRLHLRTHDPHKDNNFLWIDGQQPPIVLDNTAAAFIEYLIEAMWLYQQGDGDETERVVKYVVDKMMAKYKKRFAIGNRKVTPVRIKADLDRLFGTIMEIAEGACPVDMGLPGRPIHYGKWIAPARMDLALTYDCNLDCSKCYLGEGGTRGELSTAEWLRIYEILWKLGIPQVVFTGGEPTLRPDLVELVQEADEFVTGLVTNGTLLDKLAKPLADASLDYVQITIESHDAMIHDAMTQINGSHARTIKGIKAALEAGLHVSTNTTLTSVNAAGFEDTLRWLVKDLGVKHLASNTLICSGRGTQCRAENGLSDRELGRILFDACTLADDLEVPFQWYSPTCYTQGVNPLELGFGGKSCSAAAHNMTVQPNGTVLPCQSWPDSVGHILRDDWKSIWNHPTCKRLRDHLFKPAECRGCFYEETCQGGCPLDHSPRTGSQRGEG